MEEQRVDERLIELELRATEQQALLEDLSSVLHEQGREIAALQAELTSLRGRLEQTESRQPQPTGEKPPHY
jgi:uncharacterized coiled-coil protein SlyX